MLLYQNIFSWPTANVEDNKIEDENDGEYDYVP